MRTFCDLGHPVLQSLWLGRSQLIARLPVIAGDSMWGSFSAKVILQPFRRPFMGDIKVDMHAFFVPIRYEYGDNDYIQAVKEGTWSKTSAYQSNSEVIDALMVGEKNFPQHIVGDRILIHNRFYKDPHDTDITKATFTSTSANPLTLHYGPRCGNLKTYHTALLDPTADKSFDSAGEIPTTSSKLSVRDIPTYRIKIGELQLRAWKGQRFQEAAKQLWGASPPRSIEKWPHQLGNAEKWMSDKGLQAQSGPELGYRMAQGQCNVRLQLRKKMFQEHGTIYVLMLVRPDPVFKAAMHHLDVMANFGDYDQFMVPPRAAKLPPEKIQMADLFWDSTSTTDAGIVAFNKWWQHQPAYASRRLTDLAQGWIPRNTPTTAAELRTCQDYRDTFNTLEVGQGFALCYHDIKAFRPIADQEESVQTA